jgi:hypothetical protein
VQIVSDKYFGMGRNVELSIFNHGVCSCFIVMILKCTF